MSNSGDEPEQDVSDWEIEEGLPQFEDPFIQKYLAGREALIEQEQSKHSDNSFQASLSPIAQEACSILSRIVDEEHSKLWDSGSGKVANEQQSAPLYLGMPFHLTRPIMESTKSWQILQKMPKGGLLHAHLDASFDVDFVISTALSTPGMTIAASEPLTTVDRRQCAEIKIRFFKSTTQEGSSLWTEGYKSSSHVPLQEAAKSFPVDGLQGFVAWLRARCTITLQESLPQSQGIDAIWRKFIACFPLLNALELYEPIFRASLRHLFEGLVRDGIQWVDFRAPFSYDFFPEDSEVPCPDASYLLQTIKEEIARFQQSEIGKRFWGCRFIWTCLRSWNKKEMVTHMKACVQMKKKFPELISGFDCVGFEVRGRTLAEMAPELFWFKKHCAENEVDIPFFFHAGECWGVNDDCDRNLFDAILLGSRRIGHGFSLVNHPLLIDMVKSKKIIIESCPNSNEILRLTNCVNAHPLPALLARGVPCCLSNDDPGIFGYGTSGVTPDFWQALHGWNLSLDGLGSLAENGVRWACYEDQTAAVWKKEIADGKYGQGIKAQRMSEWRSAWDNFCEDIVKDYGIEYGGDL